MGIFVLLNNDKVSISPSIHSPFIKSPSCIKRPSDLPWAKLLVANDLWMIIGLNDKETVGKGP